MTPKQYAAAYAAAYITSGMTLGFGSGTTSEAFLEALALRLRRGEIRNIKGVPSSERITELARSLDIPTTTLDESPTLDLAVDGADEVGPDLTLIKGLGGALLRERIVMAAAQGVLIVADESKRVDVMGTRAPVPVEVLPFGWRSNLRMLQGLGAAVRLRQNPDEQPYITDNGNYILDCAFLGGIDHPTALANRLDVMPGILGHGLFIGMADAVVIGTNDGIVLMTRSNPIGNRVMQFETAE